MEFHVNAFPLAGFSFSFLAKVGGGTIKFHRDAINEFLGNPLVLQEGQIRRYQESINTVPNMEKILLDGREVEINPSDVAIRYHMEDLILKAQVFLLFILHNIRPRSHTCTFTMDTTQLLYLIMSGKRIDADQIIANQMTIVSKSGKEFGTRTRNTCPLVFPGLIMGFLIVSRVFFLEKKKKRRKAEQTGQTSSNTLNYGDWDPRLRQAFTYTWDQNDSNHRTAISLHDSFYRSFYQGEAGGHGDENDEEDVEAETQNEEGTLRGSETASDDDEKIGGDETKSEAKHPGSLAASSSEEVGKARFAKQALVFLAEPNQKQSIQFDNSKLNGEDKIVLLAKLHLAKQTQAARAIIKRDQEQCRMSHLVF
ncbi:hypothetical protein KIW84_020889 [Lathyrus oleraceus]|uniref:Putative plant transposon protein domain-containing protein n=1 Tax=Pisum sativum TaxID=3888 RepID=A0A9D4Y6B3_PEA|nr:hypothetical protein KIW84_020889 [Pisum sativum]